MTLGDATSLTTTAVGVRTQVCRTGRVPMDAWFCEQCRGLICAASSTRDVSGVVAAAPSTCCGGPCTVLSVSYTHLTLPTTPYV